MTVFTSARSRRRATSSPPAAIERAGDIRDLVVSRFYFGSDADDRLNAPAFATTIHQFTPD